MAPHTITFLPFFLALLSTTFSGHVAGKRNFTAIYIFGDSLLDTGINNFIGTTLKANHPPYGISFPGRIATGRFSNGKLMSDLLSSGLGIKDTVPPFLDPSLSPDDIRTGVCFASAGSGLDDITTVMSHVVPVSAQPGYMVRYVETLKGLVGEKEAERILGGGLVLLTAGSNDMAINFYNSGIRRSFSLDGYQNYLLQRIHQFIQSVYTMGLRNYMIGGLPAMGCSPAQLSLKGRVMSGGGGCINEMDLESEMYNKKLIALLPQIQSSLPGSKILYADLYTPFLDMATNPNKYGFTVTNRGCCGSGLSEMGNFCNSFVALCPNPSQYMFFDAVHPTEAAYRVITDHWLHTTIPHFS